MDFIFQAPYHYIIIKLQTANLEPKCLNSDIGRWLIRYLKLAENLPKPAACCRLLLNSTHGVYFGQHPLLLPKVDAAQQALPAGEMPSLNLPWRSFLVSPRNRCSTSKIGSSELAQPGSQLYHMLCADIYLCGWTTTICYITRWLDNKLK